MEERRSSDLVRRRFQARAESEKRVNVSQLSTEMGGAQVYTVGGASGADPPLVPGSIPGRTVYLADVDPAELASALAAHVARFPQENALAVVKEKAATDPAFAALLVVLGIE